MLLRTAREGALLGALIGLGFELVENQHYLTLAAVQAGTAGLVRGVWVRGILGGLKHAVFTAITGAGLGWAREATAMRAPALRAARGVRRRSRAARGVEHRRVAGDHRRAVRRAGTPTPRARSRRPRARSI